MTLELLLLGVHIVNVSVERLFSGRFEVAVGTAQILSIQMNRVDMLDQKVQLFRRELARVANVPGRETTCSE